MEEDINARIERLMDQLESQHLTSMEIEAIQGKIKFLQTLE